MPAEKFDIVIIGAGLSGLAAAVLLHESGKAVRVIEARPEAGGRIRSVTDHKGAFLADLGPTWIWPAYQPVISRWVSKLEASTFPQYSTGKTILDYGPGEIAKAAIIPGQEGSFRIEGGSKALVNSLLSKLPKEVVAMNTVADAVTLQNDQVLIGTNESGSFLADQLIVATPPRIALGTIRWQPELHCQLASALSETPTWMAPHAKIAIIYEKPFWRHHGLAGRIMSRSGPIVEAHDHCSKDKTVAALWGFIGWPHQQRSKFGSNLETEIRAQLKRCFGNDSPDPIGIYIEDWAQNRYVASLNDLSDPMNHPEVAPNNLRASHFDGRVFFAGAETAKRSPGLIEGAFDSAERVANLVLQKGTTKPQHVTG